MKIKNILAGLSLLMMFFSYSQNVSDYQYIIVAEKFSGFKPNQYKLNDFVIKSLKSKKYTVLGEINSEGKQNKCNALYADVLNNSNFLRSRVILQFKDCNSKIIKEVKTTSMEKDYDKSFQEAITMALSEIPVSNPSNSLTEDKTISERAKNIENITTPSGNIPTKFTFAGEFYQRIEIGNGQFILVAGNSSVPSATFSKSTKPDVFRVVLPNGSMTLGFLENENIIIEMPQPDGTLKRQIFQKSN